MPSSDKRKAKREAERSTKKTEKSDTKTSTKKKQEVKGERTASKASFKKKDKKQQDDDMVDPKFMHRAPYTSFNIKKVVIDEPGKGFTPPGGVLMFMPQMNYRYPIFEEDGITPKLDEGGNPIEELHVLKFEGPRGKDDKMIFRWGVTDKLVPLTDEEKKRKAKGEVIDRVKTGKFKLAGEIEYSPVSHKILRRIFLELSDLALYYLWQNGGESDTNGLGTDIKYNGGPPNQEDGSIGLTIHNYPDKHIRNPVWYKSEKEEKTVKDPKTGKKKTVTVPKFIETEPATLTFDINMTHSAYRTDFRYVWKEKIIVNDKPKEVIRRKKVLKNSELKGKGFVAIPVFEVKLSINNTNNRFRLEATTVIITKYLTSRENEQGATMRELEADMKGTNSNIYTRDELLREHPNIDGLASSSSEDESSSGDVKKHIKKIKSKKGKKSSSGSDDANSGSASDESASEDARDTKKKKKKQPQSSSESSDDSSSSSSEEIVKKPTKKTVKASTSTKATTKTSTGKSSKKPTPDASESEKSTTASIAAGDESSMQQSEVEKSELDESMMSASESEAPAKVNKTIKIKSSKSSKK